MQFRRNLDVIRCNKLRFRGTDKDQKLHEQVCTLNAISMQLRCNFDEFRCNFDAI